jgi:UDPglucose 6-dehydrogenase
VGNGTVCVFGLWHLGSVIAACLAAAGRQVVGLDLDAGRITALSEGRPPVAEPELSELILDGLRSSKLCFTSDPQAALAGADILYVAFDTPVDDDDHADTDWVRAQLDSVRPHVRPGAIVLVSSQVPVGFTQALERDWHAYQPAQRFAYSPENLRLGTAIAAFQQPDRVVIGLGQNLERQPLAELFAPFSSRLEWMSLASAEMSKHALNGYLALSVAYANELARICERVGADARDVERALRSDPRVGSKAYVSAGPPIAGGTLARDVEFLRALARANGIASPLADGIAESNRRHADWTRERLTEMLEGIGAPRVALLGLTYKPGTDTLRRSASVDLGRWLIGRGVVVRAFDPAVHAVPAELEQIELGATATGVLEGADVAVLATAWPEFRSLDAETFAAHMRRPCVVDQAGVLSHLADDPRITYARVGRPLS